MARASNSIRSPLARVRGLGSAQHGVSDWWVQRVTAVALVPLTVWFVASVVSLAGADFRTVALWMGSPVTAVLLILMLVATFRHAQLGVRVVIEDYVHHEGAKIGLLLAVNAVLALLAVGSILSVLKLVFRG
ncbi:MAG TPA: succinate dehydrogenase, hydrophobic membrane anchor protein [Alphaproteobacteria bacterium]|jgi:succinate dehydrogenase / fumarate reductase membrane anchor subunit|nr:succinate dehydrogenase, hydrophobic membrane anchor protein [Alphaproteobacteria bacterium]